jgi:hypothetical protein
MARCAAQNKLLAVSAKSGEPKFRQRCGDPYDIDHIAIRSDSDRKF